MIAMARRSVVSRFLEKVLVLDNGCHEWTASKSRDGYGNFKMAGEQYAHRAAYKLFVGHIPDGMTIDHFRYPQDGCIGPSCVNPVHLRLATQRENILRSSGVSARSAAATHCPSGHPYAGGNLYVNPKGHRLCRECNRRRARDNYRQRLEQAD